jgi:hypothetical protein
MSIGGTSVTPNKSYSYVNETTPDGSGNTFMSSVKEYENHADSDVDNDALQTADIDKQSQSFKEFSKSFSPFSAIKKK